VERIAGKYGLENECLEVFDTLIKEGKTEEGQAAWAALYDWDCTDWEPDP
jgi:hypothetical protein